MRLLQQRQVCRVLTEWKPLMKAMDRMKAEEQQKAENGQLKRARQQVERTSSSDVRTEMEKRLTRVNYSVETPFSVPSDDKEYTVIIDQFKVAADLSYSAAPIDIPYAFLIARTTGWEDFIKLDGKASLYVSGTYIGEAMLTPSTTEDTMSISLGTDRDVVIERNLMKDFRRSQTVGSRTVQQRGYEIKLKNNKAVAVRVGGRGSDPCFHHEGRGSPTDGIDRGRTRCRERHPHMDVGPCSG
jgi:hypothetical protein